MRQALQKCNTLGYCSPVRTQVKEALARRSQLRLKLHHKTKIKIASLEEGATLHALRSLIVQAFP